MSHKLEIEYLYEESSSTISEMFSKGHHEEQEFRSMCNEYYDENQDSCGEEIPITHKLIDDSKVYRSYGKKVGYFEDGKYLGWTLSYSKEPKKGYFPMTYIYIL